MEKSFRTCRGGVPFKSLTLVRNLFGSKKFNSIIGKDITPDTYDELMSYRHETQCNVANRKQMKKKQKGKKKDIVKTYLIPSNDYTTDFISKFLENSFEGKLHGGLIPEWIHLNIRWDEVRIRLMQLEYKAFLSTYYWKAIRLYMIFNNGGHCTYCSSENFLEVHHKSYDHHGIELFFLDELIVLCSSCHAHEHGKKGGKRLLNTSIK